MNNLKALKCPNCGGTINRASMICEYCGSVFNDDMAVLHVRTFRPEIEIGHATFFIDQLAIDALGPEEMSKYALKHLSAMLAEQIAPFMTVRTVRDFQRNGQRVDGVIRVVKPDYRFGEEGFR